MREERAHKRFVVRDMDIDGKMLFAREVKVMDVCMLGISLKADRRFEIGREYTVKLAYKDKALLLKGTVVWSVLNGKNTGSRGNVIPIYEAGIKFTGSPCDELRGLIDLIDSQKQRHSELDSVDKVSRQKPAPKFQSDPLQKGIVDLTVGYRLKKVSLNGLLVESEWELALDTRLPMEISLPRHGAISFMGRVAYCLRGESAANTHYNIGIEFIGMSLGDKEKVKRLIRLLNNRDEASPFYVRSGSLRFEKQLI
jgi:hypothetical protein